LQDRIVRTCAKENISDTKKIKIILKSLINKYNYQWIHSTTKALVLR